MEGRHLLVNGARLYVEEAGDGEAVIFVHGGLGDGRLWDAQFSWFSERFRTIRYDQRFFGRSEEPAEPYSLVDDLVTPFELLELETAALVGLSLGGQVAIDTALERPELVHALVPVCAAVSGYDDADADELDRRFAEAVDSGGLERGIELALEVLAPLGATPEIRRLARENLRTEPLPQGAVPKREPLNAVARLDEISAPTLIVTGDRDVAAVGAIADLLERGIPGAERLRFDSDHYLPLREGTAFNERVAEFSARAAGLRARASKPARCRDAP